MTSQEILQEQLVDLEQRHDAVLRDLDALDRRVEEALAAMSGPPTKPLPDTASN